MIRDRISKLAVDIVKAYRFGELGTRVTMLCVLKGGHQFFSDLCNSLKQLTLTGVSEPPLTFDFIRVKSYADTESTGDVKIESIGVDLKALKDRHVLLVEDIIDTGTTMALLVPYLKSFGPTTVRVATLLQKRTPKSNGFQAEFSGFSIPDKFVVGYCLDYNEVYRDMEHICIMNEQGIARHKSKKK
jgi:hypoxanthine phosphoribosyltransferase